MSRSPFMPLWVSDFLGDTMDLDASEIGAYLLLLMAQWQRGGESLPNDPVKLQRIARCGRNWAKVWGNLERFFSVDEGGVFSKRLRLESQNVAAKRDVNSRNGSLGGKAKALKTNDQNLANASETLQRNAGIPEPEPERDKRETDVSPKIAVKGSRLKADWSLPESWCDWAREQGLTLDVIRREADRFRDYWLGVAGAKGIKLDWEATWRNWMRKRIEDAAPKDGPQSNFWTGHKVYT